MTPLNMFLFVVNSCCFIAFLLQFFFITYDYLKPNHTVTESYKLGLNKMKFPIVFKICSVPGYDLSAISNAGYYGVYGFFDGKSHFNGSIIGWGGHTENFSSIDSSIGKLFYLKDLN